MFQHDVTRSGAAGCPDQSRSPSLDTGSAPLGPRSAAFMAPRWFHPTSTPVTAEPVVVGNTLWVGDAGGNFAALDTSTGAPRWSFSVIANPIHVDLHQPSYGEITSTAVWRAGRGHGDPTVYFGGGATLYALDANTGQPRWATDLDPSSPGSVVEIESSPLLVNLPGGPSEIVVGTDTNETEGTDRTGMVALDANTGALLWKYELETGQVVHSLDPAGPSDRGSGCGDVWSSPAFDAADNAVDFGSGNCNNPPPGTAVTREAIWSLDARTGQLRWVFAQGGHKSDPVHAPDDDFGSSPVILARAGGSPEVIESSKSGYAYAVDGATGASLWSTEAAQPGQSGPNLAGAIGGFIGGAATGRAGSRRAYFAASAVPLPFAGNGITQAGVTLDPSVLTHPGRLESLHALDAATGAVLWDAPVSLPTYAPVTYADGLVFAPGTVSLAAEAYDAATGLVVWVA
ncbi:MAG: PQQ-binding-like beta-propeller repeat protein, partial [Acidimicrobiales bacterium]